MTFTSGLTNQLCFAHIFKTNGGQDKREVDSCIRKHVGPLERGQIKCGDVEVENPIRHPEKFGLRLRVLIMKIAEASMQFLATLEPSSRIALKFPL